MSLLRWCVAVLLLVCMAPVYFLAVMAGTLLDFAGEALDYLKEGIAEWGGL